MNLQLNDPTLPPPGEMVNESPISAYRTASPQPITGSPIYASGDPHHYRAPSLGEIHQELEQEQEAQVVCSWRNVLLLLEHSLIFTESTAADDSDATAAPPTTTGSEWTEPWYTPRH
jgi:hypothetical protein